MTVARILSNLAVVALTMLTAGGPAIADDLQQGDERTAGQIRLRGVYGFVATGIKDVPFSAVGLFRPKKDGTFEGQALDNLSGEMVTDTFRGTLTFVSPRAGTLIGTSSLGASFSKSFVVIDSAKQIWFQSTDSGEVEAITATRQVRRRRFDSRDLRGSGAFSCSGSDTNPQTGAAGPVTSMGTLSWDAAGNFFGRGTYNNTGNIVGAVFTGSSTVNPDGTFTNNGDYTAGLHGAFSDSGVIQTASQLGTISINSHRAVACNYERLGP